MNSGPIDISSDEEQGWNEPEDDDYDWVSELLDSVDNLNDDDSDEVVVIGEVNTKPRPKSSKRTVRDVDDDCVVLDGDPDKAISVVDDSSSGSDDLVVVGEKGQIACRDYPHPRHLCAKFPFSTTLHQKHCDLCHCYVCDSLAPCVHWGTGVSNIDHCHATDKEEVWKMMRTSFKLGKTSPLPASKLSVAAPKLSQGLTLDIIRLAANSTPQKQVSRPTANRALSASLSIPSIRNPGRVHQSGLLMSNNRVQPCSVPQQLVGVHNNVVRRNRGHNVGTLGTQFASSHTMFKRVGAVGGSVPIKRSTYGFPNNSSCANPSQYGRNPAPMAALNDRNRWQDAHSSMHQRSSQPMGSIVGSTVPFQPQIYSQPIPQPTYSPNLQQQGNQIQSDIQNIYQIGNQTQDGSQGIYQYGNQSQNASLNSLQGNQGASTPDLGVSDSDYSWVNNSSQSIQQLPIENSQIQSTEAICEPSLVKEDSQSSGIANLSDLDIGFESWLLENQSVPAVSNDSVPSQLNVLSSEPTFIDTGMLMFDFETSWKGLAQV